MYRLHSGCAKSNVGPGGLYSKVLIKFKDGAVGMRGAAGTGGAGAGGGGGGDGGAGGLAELVFRIQPNGGIFLRQRQQQEVHPVVEAYERLIHEVAAGYQAR